MSRSPARPSRSLHDAQAKTAELTGVIVKSHGRRFIVELAEGTCYDCTTRGKRTDYACGDVVYLTIENAEQGVISGHETRSSLLYRSDAFRSKIIAANVSLLVLVVAPVPTFSEELLACCLLAAEAAGIEARIVLNKADLPEVIQARQQLAPFVALGYPVLELSALQDVSPLRQWLQDQTSVLVGQSGMGKSTLTNALVPEAAARVGDISVALDSGRHTTTHAQLYHLDASSHLIDSPGLQEFGLQHIEPLALAGYFPDFQPFLGQCKFHNCLHLVEPSCALQQAVQRGELSEKRVAFYQRIFRSLQKTH